MDQKQVLQKLRHDLANHLGIEKTPAEIEDIMRRAASLYNVVDLPTYRYMRDLTPGGCYMEAKKQGFEKLDEFFATRDIILFVGERKYPDETKRTDKPFLWK